MNTNRRLRIAAFGLRYLPPQNGSAGEDKFASELYPRLVARGHVVTAYLRVYEKPYPTLQEYKGVRLIYLKTTRRSGFDTLLHSCKAAFHIVFHNTGDVVHVHNGGNSIWALLLRLLGKKVFVSQDGVDWKREKWKWYAKSYLYVSSFLTAYVPNGVIFDNVFSKEWYEKRYRKAFTFIPYGSEVPAVAPDKGVLTRLGLETGNYFLFVGRFIPDKGLHYLVEAFKRIDTTKKLVLVGGSPNPSPYEAQIKAAAAADARIICPGYIYGDDVVRLMQNACAYIQPSDVEGLSPVILQVMGLGAPLICSDIPENCFIVEDHATTFAKSNAEDLREKIEWVLQHPARVRELAAAGAVAIRERFNWYTIVDQHVALFQGTTRVPPPASEMKPL